MDYYREFKKKYSLEDKIKLELENFYKNIGVKYRRKSKNKTPSSYIAMLHFHIAHVKEH